MEEYGRRHPLAVLGMNPRAIGPAKPSKNRGTNRSTARSVLVLLTILSLAFWAFFRNASSEITQPAATGGDSSFLPFFWSNIDFRSPTDPSSSRPVYPYSVVPGGVGSAEELQTAIHRDPLVSAHYSDFGVHAAQPVRLPGERQFFVSYRLGNQVYWTKKKVTLHAGEMLLTDGEHLARTRCGNRLSDVPRTPTAPSEPTDRSFNTPVVPLLPESTSEAMPGSPSWTAGSPPVLLSSPSPVPQPDPGPSGFVPPIFPIFCCDTPSGPPNSPTHPLPPPAPAPSPSPSSPLPSPPSPPQPVPYFPSEPPGAPIATPEPGALTLAAAGLMLLLVVRRLRHD